MNTFIRYPLRSLFVGASLAMLLAAEPAQAQTPYVSSNAIALPLFMDTRSNPSSLSGNGWYTMAVLQNTSKYLANVRVTATPKQGGAGVAVLQFTIGAGSTMVVRPDNPGNSGTLVGMNLGGNFEGSLLIESDGALVVIGELANIPLGSMGVAGGTAKGFYNGILVNESSGKLAFPMMKSGFNGKSTVVYVKNTSAIPSTLADNAIFTLKTNDGLTYATGMTYTTAPLVLAAGESKALTGADFKSGNEFWTKTCSGGGNVGASGGACFGVAQLASTNTSLTFAAVAVQRTVVETSPSPSVHVANFQPIVTGPATCSVFRNAYQTTARSGVNLMNAGTSTVNITLKLIDAATSTPYIQTFPGVPAGRSVAATGWAVNIGGFPDGAIGAATITSIISGTSTPDNRIVAAVSESGVGTNESSYECSSGSRALFAPFVKFSYVGANHPVQATSEVRIQNTGTGTDTTINVEYACAGVTYMAQKNIPVGSSVEINSATFATAALPGGIPAGRICSALFYGTSSFMGTVTERSSSPSSADDATYELEPIRLPVDRGNFLSRCRPDTDCVRCCDAVAPIIISPPQ